MPLRVLAVAALALQRRALALVRPPQAQALHLLPRVASRLLIQLSDVRLFAQTSHSQPAPYL